MTTYKNSMKKLTVREWLQQLPEPFRTQALDNTEIAPNPTMGDNEVDTLAHALSGFIWHHTPQGLNYWCDVQTRAERGEFDNAG